MTRIERNTKTEAHATSIYELLVRHGAYSPERAMTDREIAKAVGCPQRDVIELVELLLDQGIAIVASCGSGGDGKVGRGRYIEREPEHVDAYSKALRRRAVNIFLRARRFRKVARLMLEGRSVEPNGQRRLFA